MIGTLHYQRLKKKISVLMGAIEVLWRDKGGWRIRPREVQGAFTLERPKGMPAFIFQLTKYQNTD